MKFSAPRIASVLVALFAHFLAASVQAQANERRSVDDSATALTTLLNAAAQVNSRVPERLRSYRARVESEMSIVILDSGSRERTAQLEQVASDVRWRAPDRYDQRVIGYREQAVGPTFSLMSLFGGWTVPTLYGNNLQLGLTGVNTNKSPQIARQSTAIHPLAPNRNSYYEFHGGDTAVTLYSNGRRIPIVRVRVTPRAGARGDAILFFGDMYLDADWKQIVRMRGRLVELKNGVVTIKAGSRLPGVSGASFVELVNVEVNGQYWLPAFQRTEIQARISLFGDFRSLIRVVSRFKDYRVNDSTWTGPVAPPGTSHNLTFASGAEQQRFRDWDMSLGAASTDVYYAEFDDLAPSEWATATSDAGIHFSPRGIGDVIRFNRIEGLFTGVAFETNLSGPKNSRSLRAALGWAWAEGAARGMIGAEQKRGRTIAGLRVEKALTHTNDFQLPFSWGASLSALLGSRDDFDYLDRQSATIHVSRRVGTKNRSLVRAEFGAARDAAVQQNISQGLFVAKGQGFRPNRGIREGNYFSSAASVEINPDVSGLFVNRGVGLRLLYSGADGEISWHRVEARTAVRRELGPFQLFGRADAGALLGDPVPQALFEIGSTEGLSAYGYKQFAGDRAALARAVVGYTLPFLRAPIRLPSRLILPGIAPGIAAGIHAGWTDASSPAAERAMLELGSVANEAGVPVPLSQTTNGVRASAEFLLTLFSGSVAVGVTRQIDRSGPWKFTARMGQGF
ncbi:MAG: hypothetical protein H0W69_03740 [Gemmatimonadaceae bacterium]|nr:hypothetical protein [Gemmatimonadaceae bacterium]